MSEVYSPQVTYVVHQLISTAHDDLSKFVSLAVPVYCLLVGLVFDLMPNIVFVHSLWSAFNFVAELNGQNLHCISPTT